MESADREFTSGITFGSEVEHYSKRHIFLSGGVAVGKTSTINLLHDYFTNRDEFLFVREYIDYDSDGIGQLERLQRGCITNYQFQMYVLKCYEEQLNCVEFEDAEIIIWERHPFEALNIFCKNDQTLTTKERLKLELRLDALCDKYEIPKLEGNTFDYYDFDTCVFKTEYVSNFIIGDVIYPMLMGEYERNVFIFLYCSELNEQFDRLIGRGRNIEIEVYKQKEDLLMINNEYFGFYLMHSFNSNNS